MTANKICLLEKATYGYNFGILYSSKVSLSLLSFKMLLFNAHRTKICKTKFEKGRFKYCGVFGAGGLSIIGWLVPATVTLTIAGEDSLYKTKKITKTKCLNLDNSLNKIFEMVGQFSQEANSDEKYDKLLNDLTKSSTRNQVREHFIKENIVNDGLCAIKQPIVMKIEQNNPKLHICPEFCNLNKNQWGYTQVLMWYLSAAGEILRKQDASLKIIPAAPNFIKNNEDLELRCKSNGSLKDPSNGVEAYCISLLGNINNKFLVECSDGN